MPHLISVKSFLYRNFPNYTKNNPFAMIIKSFLLGYYFIGQFCNFMK
jgi:hypothetical protein